MNPQPSANSAETNPPLKLKTDTETIRTKVREIVARQFGVKPSNLDMNRPLEKYGDELDVVEAVMSIEESYSIMIPDERIMDKRAKGSVGIHKDLSTAKLVEIVTELITSKQNSKAK